MRVGPHMRQRGTAPGRAEKVRSIGSFIPRLDVSPQIGAHAPHDLADLFEVRVRKVTPI